jgi:Asp-tRNA(Asn)/Glu-tRNA(Gln) amidotransferase A subunit family amidase
MKIGARRTVGWTTNGTFSEEIMKNLINKINLHRRQFLQLLGAGAGAAAGSLTGIAVCRDGAAAASAGHGLNELLELTAIEAIVAMRAGDLRAETYAAVLLARAHSLRRLNALLSQDAIRVLIDAHAADKRRARGKTLGPLHGLPILIKENINTAALRTTAATPSLINNRPGRNAVVVERLLDAGAILFGKTNMHEAALGVTSNNFAFGPVRNPYDPTKIPGGSSGGNACGVAARMAPASLGTDTAGSVRIPAALCGIASLRPTVGRYPRTGDPNAVSDIVPLSHRRDTPGPMARTVADVALLDAVITGANAKLKLRDMRGVRLGVDRRNFFENLDPETESVMNDALRRLRDCGATPVEMEVQNLQALNSAISIPVGAFDIRHDLPRYLADNNTGVTLDELIAAVASPDVRALFGLVVGPNAIPEQVSLDALALLPDLQAAYQRAFADFNLDALVFPTTPLPARPIGQDVTVDLNGQQVSTFGAYIRNTDPGSNAGIPGLNIPVGLTRDGLPVGLELDGPAWSDRKLLAIGLAVEEEFGSLPAPTPERLCGAVR